MSNPYDFSNTDARFYYYRMPYSEEKALARSGEVKGFPDGSTLWFKRFSEFQYDDDAFKPVFGQD